MTALPASPYKGLAAFADSPLDALLFFGRESEREAIVANLMASRLTVLYGPSGVGKSSLLRAGVAQRLRTVGDGSVIVHDTWAEDPEAALIASAHDADPNLGPTAGLVDTIAAAAQRNGQVYLLLDQFEEYFLHHGATGPLSEPLPELLRRPGLRVNILIALRNDALAELDAFAGRVHGLFANMLRLDRLDRRSARSAILGPLGCFGELSGSSYAADPALVDELLHEVAAGRVDLSGTTGAQPSAEHIEAPFLQLVLERLWAEERDHGSRELRLETFRRLGGAEPILRDHVQGTLDRLPADDQDAVARLIRQLVTPTGTKTSHTAADLAAYTAVDNARLESLLAQLGRERIVRAVEGAAGGPTRFEIFHDVLAEPLLAWRANHDLEGERIAARRQRHRLISIAAAALLALVVVGAIAIFALTQRSTARSQARRAHARELAAQALAGIPSNPARSLALALEAARIAAGPETESVLRTSLLATRERRIVRVGGAVVDASFSPSGGRLLVVGSNGSLGLYDRTGARIAALPRQTALTSAVWSPDGSSFATGGVDGSVVVWRSDGRQLRRVETTAPITVLTYASGKLLIGSGGRIRILSGVHGSVRTIRLDGSVVAAAVAPNGKLLAVATKRKGRLTTRIFDIRKRHVRATLPERGIGSLTFSADGYRLVTGSTDKTARIWRASTGRLLHTLPHRGHVLAERFSPDGKSLVTSSADGTAAVWDVRTGTRVLLLTGANGIAEDATFSPDEKEVAVAFGDRAARIYSTEDGRLLAPLAGHTDAVTSIHYDQGGHTIVTGSDDGTARLWDANAGDALVAIDHRASTVDALFVGGRVLSVAGRQARVVDLNGRRVASIRLRAPITAAAARGEAFSLVDEAGDLERVLGPDRTETISDLGVAAAAYASDGNLVTGSRDGTIRIWRPGQHAAQLIRGPAHLTSVSAADGRFLVRTRDGSVRVYASDGGPLRTLVSRAQRATLSPNGTVVVTTNAREADLWDVSTGKLLHRLTGHRSLVTDAEFSSDSSRLVTASDDHDARIWDVATGRLEHVLRGHFFAIRTAVFSPDGRWTVTASQFTAGLWDVQTGQLVLYLRGNTRPLTGATFSPDGNWILTGSEDGTARVVRCDICRDLSGLEQAAQERLRSIG
jgi:WD40 repeat protein